MASSTAPATKYHEIYPLFHQLHSILERIDVIRIKAGWSNTNIAEAFAQIKTDRGANTEVVNLLTTMFSA